MVYTTTDITFRRRQAVGKRLRYESHREFLDECIGLSVIPKGFRLKWDLQLDAEPTDSDRCKSIKTDAALKLMQVARNVCDRKATAMISVIDSLYPETDIEEVYSIQNWTSDECKRLRQNKLHKLRSLKGEASVASHIRSATYRRTVTVFIVV